MSKRAVDLVIAGASFAGLICARTAALRGLNTVVIEAKADPGAPLHTTGILVKEARDEIDTPPQFSRAIRRVRQVDFHRRTQPGDTLEAFEKRIRDRAASSG